MDGILAPKRPQSLNSYVQEQFGLLADQDRGNVLPLPDGDGGIMAPQWLYEMGKAVLLPSHVAKGGDWSLEDVTNMALTIGGTAGAASMAGGVPKGALASNAVRQHGVSGEGFAGLIKNPRKKYSQNLPDIQAAGAVDDDASMAVWQEMKKAKEKQRQRAVLQNNGNDPLEGGGRSRMELEARRSEEARRIARDQEKALLEEQVSKKLQELNASDWNKSFLDQVTEQLRLGEYGMPRDAINRANLEAVPRLLKKEGWTMRHASSGKSGRKSSRYLVSPDGKYEVRVSDHYLPDTPQRQYSRQTMGGPRWDDEMVLHGSESPQDIISEIKGLLSERVEDGYFDASGSPAGLLAPKEEKKVRRYHPLYPGLLMVDPA